MYLYTLYIFVCTRMLALIWGYLLSPQLYYLCKSVKKTIKLKMFYCKTNVKTKCKIGKNKVFPLHEQGIQVFSQIDLKIQVMISITPWNKKIGHMTLISVKLLKKNY